MRPHPKDSPVIRIIISGAKGRMGQALVAGVEHHPGLDLIGQVDLGDDLRTVIKEAEVVIDFSFHEATAGTAAICGEHRKPMVIGTTGHTPDERSQITPVAARIPIVWAPNFSTGVNTLFWLARKAAEILGPAYDIEIVEMHHRHKKDAPSGTAGTLAEILATPRDQPPLVRHGRQGITGERAAAEIGVHSLRGGDVVGDHTVIFAGSGERIELTHRASSRDTFAQGALRAAQWVVQQKPGLYSMQDVLGLR